MIDGDFGNALDLPDVENKFLPTTGSYEAGEVSYPVAVDALEGRALVHNLEKNEDGKPVIAERFTRAIPLGNLNADKQVATMQADTMRIMGFAVTENAGAPARIRIVDGLDTNGSEIADIPLTANQFLPFYFGSGEEGGITLKNGIYINVVTGAIKVTLYVR